MTLIISQSVAAEPALVTSFHDCVNCPEMVEVHAGSFSMGSSDADTKRDLAAVPPAPMGLASLLGFTEQQMALSATKNEHPQHQVHIEKGFAISRFLVTKGQFAEFVRATGYVTAQCDSWDHPGLRHLAAGAWSAPGFEQSEGEPVVCVSWGDAKAFITWLNRKASSDKKSATYRLPSEAEWEYAARAESQTSRWWGNEIGVGQANCRGCAPLGQLGKTTPLGATPPNPFGLFDVLGNVWELTEDCWSEDYVNAPVNGAPTESANCRSRVMRGGSWDTTPPYIRSAARSRIDAGYAQNITGFRVVKDLQ